MDLLKQKLESLSLSEESKDHKYSLDDFTILQTVGKNYFTLGTGSFGRVRLVKFKEGDSKPYVLKILKKTEIIRLNQIDHIRDEK